jgi:hypothetical protein
LGRIILVSLEIDVKKRKIIIHVGLQKTASKYLQDVFFPRLNNVAYIGRPYTQENYAFNSLQYADNSIYNVSVIREEFDRIENKIAKDNTILISDELFSGFPFYNYINRGVIAERLSKVIPDAEIVLFLRGQINLIMSLYNQYVKIGWVDNHLDESFLHRPGSGFPLEKWIEGKRSWDMKNRFINNRSIISPEHFRYSKLYSLYSNLFRKVHVFLYEDFQIDQKTCLQRLSSLLSSELPTKFALDEALHKKIVNKKLDKKQLRVQLELNRLSHILPYVNSRYVKTIVRSIVRSISKLSSEKLASDNQYNNIEHVISLLKERDIFNDNYLLNKKLNLGMEKHPRQYFRGAV